MCNVVVRDSIRDGYSKDGRVRDIAMVSKVVSEAVVEVAWAQLQQTEALVLENDKLRKGIEGYEKVLANLELTADAASTTEPGTPNVSIHSSVFLCSLQEEANSLSCGGM